MVLKEKRELQPLSEYPSFGHWHTSVENCGREAKQEAQHDQESVFQDSQDAVKQYFNDTLSQAFSVFLHSSPSGVKKAVEKVCAVVTRSPTTAHTGL